MILRDQIVQAFQRDHAPRGVRELMDVIASGKRASVSKECLLMASVGLLTYHQENNWHHGRRFVFTPTELLFRAGRFSAGGDVVLAIVKAGARPLTSKEVRYCLGALLTLHFMSRPDISAVLERLVEDGTLARDGQSARYPRYGVVCSDCTPRRLQDVMKDWCIALPVPTGTAPEMVKPLVPWDGEPRSRIHLAPCEALDFGDESLPSDEWDA